MKVLKTNTILLAATLLLLSCSTGPENFVLTGTWDSIGLAEEDITVLDIKGEDIFAAGKTRLYKKNTSAAESEWADLNLQINPDDSEFGDILYRDSILYAAVRNTIDFEAVPEDFTTLYKSSDEGETWQPVEINLEGRNKPYVINRLAQSDQAMYADWHLIFKSVDGGNVWTNLTSDNHVGISEFLYISKDHPDQIWTGGWTNIFYPYLAKSEDGGATWTILNREVFWGAEVSIRAALVHPKDSRQVMIAFGGGILRKSSDSGETWENVAIEGGGIANLTPSIKDSRRVYGTGQNEQGTLFFAVSDDFGDSWQTVEFEDGPSGIRVNDMLSVLQNGREVLYFATSRGVYSYTFEE